MACIPTKTLIRTAEVAELVRRAGSFGLEATLTPPDASQVRARKGDVVHAMRQMNLDLFHASGLELVMGTARFVAPRRVEVATDDGPRILEGDQCVINVGTRPALPPIPGLRESAPLTSESLLELTELPARLIVLGGSYVGLELAQALRRLGSQVTVVEGGSRLVGREDEDVSDAVAELLRSDGIGLVLGATIDRVERAEDETVGVHVTTADGAPHELRADDVLAALGRVPNTDGLDLGLAEVDVDDRGFVTLDDRLATTATRTWAAGDVNGGPQFTHVSWDDWRILATNLGGGSRSTADRLVPYAMFIDPEVGRVGLTEREAVERGLDVRIARIDAFAVPRAHTSGATRGLLKAVVERDSDRILGATVLADRGGEVASIIQVAMLAGMTATTLRDTAFSHPTWAEGLNLLFANLDD
ncbi:MAG: merA [Thermoleophilia bacterium]|nr:merA [Thermoleophilia bacterium]